MNVKGKTLAVPYPKTSLESMLPIDHSDWIWQMQNRIRNWDQVESKIQVTEEEREAFGLANEKFEFAVTPYYFSLIDPKDPNCPIRLQAIPRLGELTHYPNEKEDPLAEQEFMPVKGITHRYPDRAIWYLSHNCAVFCRFCTRKRKVSKSIETPKREEWEEGLNYFRKTNQIREVILSGGDPLSLGDKQIQYLLEELKGISHINQIRIHTRHLVTLPQRFTPELLQVFAENFPIYIVTHFNHAKELTEVSKKAIRDLIQIGNAIVFNQSVLLKGVNDTVEAQKDLNFALLSVGIKPYYLHQCDEIYGISQFKVAISTGMEIYKQLRGFNSGLAIPTYVQDLTGGGGKVPLVPEYLIDENDTHYKFRNYQDKEFLIAK